MTRHNTVVWALRFGAIATLLGLWLYGNGIGGVPNLLLPNLGEVLETLAALVLTGTFWEAVALTFTEILAGFFIAALLGVGAGFWGARKTLRAMVVGKLALWGYMAPLVLFYPLFLMWFGIGPASKIAFVVFATFFPLAYGSLRAFRSVDARFLTVARAFGASALQMDWLVKYRAALPMLSSSLRIGLAMSSVIVIFTEMLASQGGLGYLLSYASETFASTRSFALIITIIIVVGLFQIAVKRTLGFDRRSA